MILKKKFLLIVPVILILIIVIFTICQGPLQRELSSATTVSVWSIDHDNSETEFTLSDKDAKRLIQLCSGGSERQSAGCLFGKTKYIFKGADKETVLFPATDGCSVLSVGENGEFSKTGKIIELHWDSIHEIERMFKENYDFVMKH